MLGERLKKGKLKASPPAPPYEVIECPTSGLATITARHGSGRPRIVQGRSCANCGVALSGGFYKPPGGPPNRDRCCIARVEGRRRAEILIRVGDAARLHGPAGGKGGLPASVMPTTAWNWPSWSGSGSAQRPSVPTRPSASHSSASGSRAANGGVSRVASWVPLAPRPWTPGACERSGRPRDPRHTEALVVPLVSDYRDTADP